MKDLILKLEKKGINCRQVALGTGLNPSTISRIKNGGCNQELLTARTVRLITEFAKKNGVKV